ncbi:MAG: iron-containing redox enzyme family protein, partial [Myxococcota bacterium]
RRAGIKTQQIGMTDVGRRLQVHAKSEAGHHLMLIEDTKVMVERYNQTFGGNLDAKTLMDRPLLESTQAYIDLHERVISSSAPYLQVAIEFEIESLSVSVGAFVIEQYKRLLGAAHLDQISFLTEHVEIDVGHTAFNQKLLQRLLAERPSALPAAIETGTSVLRIYGAFLNALMANTDDTVAAMA